MEETTIRVSYSIPLTGSSFFDTVIYAKAQEFSHIYPGIRVNREETCIDITGEMTEEDAAQLRCELDIE